MGELDDLAERLAVCDELVQSITGTHLVDLLFLNADDLVVVAQAVTHAAECGYVTHVVDNVLDIAVTIQDGVAVASTSRPVR